MVLRSYDRSGGQQLVPVNGKVLFTTNSLLVEFMPENRQEVFPLLFSYGSEGEPQLRDSGRGYGVTCVTFQIEAEGYLLISPDAEYNIFHAAPFEKFNFSFSDVVTSAFWVPRPAVTVGSYGINSGPDPGRYTYYQLYFSNGTNARYQILNEKNTNPNGKLLRDLPGLGFEPESPI